MKILCTYVTANTQIHTGKCYYIGITGENKTATLYNIETSGSAAAANVVGYKHENAAQPPMLPKPGVECSNGLYIVVDGNEAVYWSLG